MPSSSSSPIEVRCETPSNCIFDSTADLLTAAARTIVQRVQAGARTIALSGGSTPKPLHAMLGTFPLRDELAEFPSLQEPCLIGVSMIQDLQEAPM